MNNSSDFTISFLGTSYDISTVYFEVGQYSEETFFSAANFIQHNSQIFDLLQEKFDEWKIIMINSPIQINKNMSEENSIFCG